MLFNSLLSINSAWISVVPFLPPSKLHLGYYRDLFIESLLLHLFIHSLHTSAPPPPTMFTLVLHAFKLIVFFFCLSFPPCLDFPASSASSSPFPSSSIGKEVETWKCCRFCCCCSWVPNVSRQKTAKSLLLPLLSTINYYWWCKWPLLNTTVWDASHLTAPLPPLCFFSLSQLVSLYAHPSLQSGGPFSLRDFHISHKEGRVRSCTFCLATEIHSWNSISGGNSKGTSREVDKYTVSFENL